MKSTIIGAILAALVALQPLLTEGGYTFDTKTVIKFVIAGLIAALGYVVKDKDSTP